METAAELEDFEEQFIEGTVRIRWVISGREAGLPPDHEDSDDLTEAQTRRLLERIELAVLDCLPDTTQLYIDGRERPPITVGFDANDAELEITEGPVDGEFELIRRELDMVPAKRKRVVVEIKRIERSSNFGTDEARCLAKGVNPDVAPTLMDLEHCISHGQTRGR